MNGFGYVWESQSVDNDELFLSLFVQSLKDQWTQNWFERISLSSKLISYCGFQSLFEHELYLNCITNRKYRHVISQFRISAHDLEIERERYNGIDRSDRICKLCRRSIEDEFHFVLSCSIYIELRQKYIPIAYHRAPSAHKFKRLMNVTDKKIANNIALYFHHVNERRTSYLQFAHKQNQLRS